MKSGKGHYMSDRKCIFPNSSNFYPRANQEKLAVVLDKQGSDTDGRFG